MITEKEERSKKRYLLFQNSNATEDAKFNIKVQMEAVINPLMAIEAAIREGSTESSNMTPKTLQRLKLAHKQLTERGKFVKVAAERGWPIAKKLMELEGKPSYKNLEKAAALVAKEKKDKEKPSYTSGNSGGGGGGRGRRRGGGQGGSGGGGAGPRRADNGCFICGQGRKEKERKRISETD